MPFLPPMLATRLEDPRRLADPRYIAEPKLDGQRAQVHVRGGRTVACYSRPGLDLLRHAGMAWLRVLAWPAESAIFDGEAVPGDGNEGIQAVFRERRRRLLFTAEEATDRSDAFVMYNRIGHKEVLANGLRTAD